MIGWSFPSRNNGDIEGFSNPALEWFKGSPLRALAREVCQNSLDAQYEDLFRKERVSMQSVWMAPYQYRWCVRKSE